MSKKRILHWLFGPNSLWGKFFIWIDWWKPVYVGWLAVKETTVPTEIPENRDVPEDPGEKDDDPYDIFKPEPKYTVPVDDRVPVIKQDTGTPFFVFPCFLPDLLVNRKFRYRDIQSFIKRFTGEQAGNSMRFFTSAVPEPKLVREMYMPFKKKDGIYQLPNPYDSLSKFYEAINKNWLNMVIARLRLFLDARIFTIIELIDNCSIHIKLPGYWNAHWLNPVNNNQDFPHEPEAAVYHYYEYWKGGVHESDHSQEIVQQYTNVGTFLEQFWSVMLDAVLSRLSIPQIMYLGVSAGNEVKAGVGWHERLYSIIFAALMRREPLIPHGWRIFTNPWIHPDTSLPDHEIFHLPRKKLAGYRQIIHGIYSEKERLHAEANCSDKLFISSHDGNVGSPSALALRVLMKNIIERGQSGYELMEGVWEQYFEHEKHGGPAYDLTKVNLTPGSQAMDEYRIAKK
jgi:hypothetical protein